jgi:hypothetical protein
MTNDTLLNIKKLLDYPQACGNQTILLGTGYVSLLTPPENANYAIMTIDSGEGRVWWTGANPTATNGLSLQAFDLTGRQNLLNFRAIGTIGTPLLNIQYFYLQA